MPLVRIELPESIDARTGLRIGEAINQAMMEVIGVPNGDKFQIIARHPPEGRNLTAEYLGVRPQDVFINLVEVAKENWSFGNGEMQYGPQ